MNCSHRVACVSILLLLATTMAGSPARGAPRGDSAAESPIAGELRREIHNYFSNQLRSELGLTDAQTDEILPVIEEIETARTRFRRERARIVHELRRGLGQGATDDELQTLLNLLDAEQREQRRVETAAMVRIDEQLTVRQRVQFRFFIERFRRNLEQRIQEFRGGGGRTPRRGGPARPR